MTHLFLGGFYFLDFGDQLRSLVLELSEPGGQIGRSRAIRDLDIRRLDLPFPLFLTGFSGQGWPERGERRMPFEQLGPAASDRGSGAIWGSFK